MFELAKRRFRRAGVVGALALGVAAPLVATDFIVLSPFDSGAGTLRQAILDANNDVLGGPHRILFNLPQLGSKRIVLATPLPGIVATVTIDGFSQPGASPNTLVVGNDSQVLVEIDGSGTGSTSPLLDLLGEGSVVRGLSLAGTASTVGIDLLDRNMTIEGCWIGLGTDGTVRSLLHGVHGLLTLDGHRIGGPLPEHRNVFVGHANRAIVLSGSNTIIQGNYIGTDATGARALGQTGAGISLFFGSSNNQVGGLAPGEGNVLSGLFGVAIQIEGGTQIGQGNRIEGNLIGMDATGTVAIPNVGEGITVAANLDARILGNSLGNLSDQTLTLGTAAIDVLTNSLDTVVQGNRVGVGLDDGPMPNEGIGIRVAAANDTVIGGFGPGEANWIANTYGSPGVGVAIYEVPDRPLGGIPAMRNSILGNRITTSQGLGIDLVVGPLDIGLEGPTANDPGDLDDGPNGLLNAPSLLSAHDEGAQWRLIGEFDGAPGQIFEFQFFSNPACHPSGRGEGDRFLGTSTVATDANGFAAFEALVAPPPGDHRDFAALATDTVGNTSEFGLCLPAVNVVEVPTTWPGLVGLFAGLALVAMRTLRPR